MYQKLEARAVARYLRDLPQLEIPRRAELAVEEIGDGNVNFVYRVTCQDTGRKLILKQAVPYLRLAGTSWPLDRARMNAEIRALKVHGELVPELVPRVYHADEEMSLVVMEYLAEHVVLRRGLMGGKTYPLLAEHLSTFMATTLFQTSNLCLGSAEKALLMAQFSSNTSLCSLSEDLIFSFPFMDSSTNSANPAIESDVSALRRDDSFMVEVAELKSAFTSRADALVHGDLHVGSIMVTSVSTRVIDPEFAFFGPFGFDPGKLFGNFLLAHIGQAHWSATPGPASWLLSTMFDILERFFEKFDALWSARTNSGLLPAGYLTSAQRESFRRRLETAILQDAVGFAGIVIARRVVGIAGVADLREIPDRGQRARLERQALRLAAALLRARRELNVVADLRTLVHDFFAANAAA